MIGYRLNTSNDGPIEIFFEPGQACELIISKKRTYIFKYENDSLVINFTINKEATIHELDFTSIQRIQSSEIKIELIHREAHRNPCCSIGTKEWCVKNGCMNAPCGEICG